MIHFKQGDLFSTQCDVIAHGCNTVGGFGGGVAGQIARLFPAAQQAYYNKFDTEGWGLGEIQFVYTAEGVIIANMATQPRICSFPGEKVVDFEAVRVCLTKLFDICSNKHYNVVMPLIGCGLGGGTREEFLQVLEEVMKDRDIHIEVWELA